MQTHPYENLRLPASVMAVGAFDGVHRGHQALIRQAVKRADELGVPAVVYTFDPPPRAYLQGSAVLTPLPEKLRRLEVLGVDDVIIAHFNACYAARSAQEFIDELADLQPLEVWVGPNFRFGEGRAGSVNALRKHFAVRELGPIRCSSGEVISSSRVRALLAEGDLRKAQMLLGWEA